jgi:hypothetical protein
MGEMEMIDDHKVIKIRIMNEGFLEKIEKEVRMDRWKVLMLMYKMPKEGRVEDYEICKKILEKEEMYMKRSGENRKIDNSEILKRPIYFVDGEMLVMSHFTLRDVFVQFSQMKQKMKDV